MDVQYIDRGITKQGVSVRIAQKVTVQILGDSKVLDLTKKPDGKVWHIAPIMIKELGITKQEQFFTTPQKAGANIKMDFSGDLIPDFRLFQEK
jgi:hypothetical protein